MSCSICVISTRIDPEIVIQSQTVCIPQDCGDDPMLQVAEIGGIANSLQKWGC